MASVSFLSVAIILCNTASAKTENIPPNILFILFDDLGWSDVSFKGGKYPTPNIDSLFTNGINLDRHYSALLCSVSRSQFLTGRFSMYQGLGKMAFFSPGSIASIPMGLPTIADYLRTYKNYKTYAIGKWHIGYSAANSLPTEHGFDHFYGFYTGMISYSTLQSIEDRNHRTDFHQDGQNLKFHDLKNQMDDEHEFNSMYLYRDKAIEHISEHKDGSNPFYLYLSMQSPHGPLPSIHDYDDECFGLLENEKNDKLNDYKQRIKYCQIMLLSDDIIGDILTSLHQNELYENTLIILTTDNGGDLANSANNFPLRGTKATMFEGNVRTSAVLSGGYLPKQQLGTMRSALFSSLDWTPTLLHFADIDLDDLDEKSWDGMDQYDLIMNGEKDQNINARDHIVLNIGRRDLKSATIVFEYFENGQSALYKYMAVDKEIDTENFVKWRTRNWCMQDENGGYFVMDSRLDLMEFPDKIGDELNGFWLFNLDKDESETMNLLKGESESESERVNEIVSYAHSLLLPYTEHPLFCEHIKGLFEKKVYEPKTKKDEKFFDTFLTNEEYGKLVKEYMDFEENDNPISNELRSLYTQKWKGRIEFGGEDDKYAFVMLDAVINGLDESVLVSLCVCFGMITALLLLAVISKFITVQNVSLGNKSYGTF